MTDYMNVTALSTALLTAFLAVVMTIFLTAMPGKAEAASLFGGQDSGWKAHASEAAALFGDQGSGWKAQGSAQSGAAIAIANLLGDQDSEVYTVVDQMPEIVGGTAELYKNIRYPREAASQGIEGRVYLQFVVDENGIVEDPTVLRDIGGGCGEAAIDAIKKISFEPGVHQGSRVKVLFTLPITFRLDR